MAVKKSIVSIGLPVFNGDNYIRHTLDSILAQTYKDFELIISDNASTDKTQQICLDYAKRDQRIRYYRNKENIGAVANFNRVFLLSSGKYFKWVTHDDLLAPEYLEKCVHVLDSDSSIVLCHSKMGLVDENGVSVKSCDDNDKTPSNLGSWKPHKRFGHIISPRSYWAIMGVVRADCLAKTPLQGCYIGADTNLLAELSLMGRICEIQECLFFRRMHRQAYSSIYSSKAAARDYSSQLSWLGGRQKKRFLLFLPHWMRTIEYFRSVNRVPLKFSERLLCSIEIVKWLLRNKGVPLVFDLINEYRLWRIRLHYGQPAKGDSKSN